MSRVHTLSVKGLSCIIISINNMNKIIIGTGIAILILGGLVWIARPGSPNGATSSAKSGEALAIEEANNYDFGIVSMAAGKVKHQFKIKNTSNEVVTINKIYTSCMCTTASLTAGGKQFGPYGMPGHDAIPRIDQTVTPNEEVVVEVIFDPAAHGPAGVGRIQRAITVENDAGQPIEFQFVAMVTP